MDIRLDVDRLDHAEGLDQGVDGVRRVLSRLLPRGRLKDALHGTWLGHPLHPMLTDLPIGCWTNAMLLDAWGGERTRAAADRLVATGVLAALPTAAAGWADWSELDQQGARTGLVHASANVVGLSLYAASYLARRRGRRGAGIFLSYLGATAVTVGGYLGGHLSYRRGAGVSRNAFEVEPEGWVPVLDEADLPEGAPVRAQAGEVGVVVYRGNGRIYALTDVCSHLGGPLHEGTVTDGGHPCITCPWHGSTFRLEDGTVITGPAQSPAPAFDARVEAGKVELRLRVGSHDEVGG